ncbi:hypothetical protein QEN58_03960 [Halomonas alkaliantarctica]|uniref:Uncharacterized protein n=1 Tax=Halomonas alkaliantarctica TaxID=232346 RepID=A0ABY8LSD6_9GAMM|nr:hypothetical protein [Halomonas alkaliantarctica]WGI26223.1 hypothetical protein QEN58_03960 [Halomonas alkaliantarctica]
MGFLAAFSVNQPNNHPLKMAGASESLPLTSHPLIEGAGGGEGVLSRPKDMLVKVFIEPQN